MSTAATVGAVLGALVVAGLAAWGLRRLLRGRPRWLQAVVWVVAVVAAAQWLVLPFVTALLALHAQGATPARAATLGIPGAADVRVAAADGTTLAGWWVPGGDGAAVILLPGAHDTRTDVVDHLRLLHDAGFAVLAVDPRGHGSSGGRPNALGWAGAEDVAGVIAFVRARGVAADRIGALGLSMGGEEALRSAATGAGLHAVVADGAGVSTAGDRALVEGGLPARSVAWMTSRMTELLGGRAEPPPLRDLVGRIRAPVLLIASGAADEAAIDHAYARRIGTSATVWEIPAASHTGGLRTAPAAYRARVVAFLRRALA